MRVRFACTKDFTWSFGVHMELVIYCHEIAEKENVRVMLLNSIGKFSGSMCVCPYRNFSHCN